MTHSELQTHAQALLELRDVKVCQQTESGMLKVVDGVDFTVAKGRTLGLVGESGCGKSMTAKAILNIQPKGFVCTGNIVLHQNGEPPLDLLRLGQKSKELRSVRGGKIAMIFQEPMAAFSPLYTIGNQMMEMVRAHRAKQRKEAEAVCIEMLRLVGIPDPERAMNRYPHEFSGGMMQRIMIAMALSCRPELLIADEPTTALDVTIQAQVLELMKELQQEFGMAMLFITHDLATVAEMCDEVAVMYLGKIVEKASVTDIFSRPMHPYTKGLIGSIPKIGQKQERLESIEGTVPVPIDLPPMCGFYDRCKERIPGLCNRQEVPVTRVSSDHTVRCFLHSDEHTGTTDNPIEKTGDSLCPRP